MAANAKPAELKDMLQEGKISYVSQICIENSDQNTRKLKYFLANLWFHWEFYKHCMFIQWNTRDTS